MAKASSREFIRTNLNDPDSNKFTDILQIIAEYTSAMMPPRSGQVVTHFGLPPPMIIAHYALHGTPIPDHIAAQMPQAAIPAAAAIVNAAGQEIAPAVVGAAAVVPPVHPSIQPSAASMFPAVLVGALTTAQREAIKDAKAEWLQIDSFLVSLRNEVLAALAVSYITERTLAKNGRPPIESTSTYNLLLEAKLFYTATSNSDFKTLMSTLLLPPTEAQGSSKDVMIAYVTSKRQTASAFPPNNSMSWQRAIDPELLGGVFHSNAILSGLLLKHSSDTTEEDQTFDTFLTCVGQWYGNVATTVARQSFAAATQTQEHRSKGAAKEGGAKAGGALSDPTKRAGHCRNYLEFNCDKGKSCKFTHDYKYRADLQRVANAGGRGGDDRGNGNRNRDRRGEGGRGRGGGRGGRGRDNGHAANTLDTVAAQRDAAYQYYEELFHAAEAAAEDIHDQP